MMFPGAQSCLNPCLYVASLDSDQPLSSYHIDALASRLSPHTKDIYRDKSTIVDAHHGATHDGVKFLEGFLPGIEKFGSLRMKKSQFERIFHE